MVRFSYLKCVFGSSPYWRNAGNFVDDLGIAFRFLGLLSARAFSSAGDTETRNGQRQDGLKHDPLSGLLQIFGFTSEQVANVSKHLPDAYSAEKISPKLRFLRAIIGSDNDVIRCVTANPRVLASSLKNQLEPNYKFMKSILEDDDSVAKCIRRSSRLLTLDLEGNLAAKVSFLRGYGFPNASIAKLMQNSPNTLALSFSKLEETLKKAENFGFIPSSPMIVSAIKAIGQINESNWEQKLEVYRKWGWSDDDFVYAFKNSPLIMCLSEEKINKGMDVFLNRLGMSSSDIARFPNIIFYSVEERIVPRCSVVALLHSKGVLGDRPLTISTYARAIKEKEEAFVKRFVDKYPEHVLELWQKFGCRAVV
ncbi:PREDICTED: transcription termination factor MTERF5, chloroplastic-like [Tarenaya hassleriana]|uniref:transcription termination factor MTERF5, chloroplastic-like n=1 Tax=Tarenaya hassleriana TaxID=28532 RepID=UPI00053CA32F|nr:PREDICTED: transcription termination factor MTERF5, chloroplastic-like [Tarenaya hassleriana]